MNAHVLPRRSQALAGALGAMAALLCGLAAPAATGPQLEEGVRLNYVNADIRDVIRSLAAILGVNVLITQEVPPKRVTYATAAPVPLDQLGTVFEAILETQGLVLVQKGPVLEVLPADKAPATGPVHFGKELPTPPPLGLVTQIVPLQFIRPEEAIEVLKQLIGPTARIEIVPRMNSVLITDSGTNVARYLELLRQLDAKTDGEAGLRTYVVPLKHASATELAATLAQIFGAAVPAVAAPPRARALEERSLSRTLQAFRRRELEALQMRREVPFPIQLQAPPETAPPTPEVTGLVGETTIVPNPPTNSLLIRTAPANFPLLRETIEALDVRPPQVLLEVLIAEITLDRATQFGIDWSVLAQRRIEGEPGEVTARFGPQQFTDSALAGVQDLVFRVVRLNSVDTRAVLRALAERADVRVLSTPHILALNNEEARILVGSEVPFSQSTRTGLDVVVDRIIQFRDVGTQLTIIPTINQDGYVTFRLLQEVSALTAQTIAAALDAPVITVREAETSAIVKDGQTVVIGGLIDESTELVESGVPVLKDIPILGYLFKSRSTRRLRTELAIFLTPYVVFTDEEAEAILERERQRMKESQEQLEGALPRKPAEQPKDEQKPPKEP